MAKYAPHLFALTTLFLCGNAGFAMDEENVPLDKLPAAIKAAVKARFPDAELVSASKEAVEGKTVFEVSIKNKGQKGDVTFTSDGAITEIELTIERKDVPKPVVATLDAKYPKATLAILEQVFKVKDGKENLEYYEFLLTTADKKKLEVCIAPDGKFVKEEDKSKDKDP